MAKKQTDKIKPEDLRPGIISEKELRAVGDVYTNFYTWKAYRDGLIKHFQNYSFEEMLVVSRELFWNSVTTESQDLRDLGLDFSIPFARKETLDFLGRLTSLNIKPKIAGDELDAVGMKVLNGMYTKWRFKSNDKVEKFWEMLYGLVNGTVCSYVGYTNTKFDRRYLRSYDPSNGNFSLESKVQSFYNDVSKEIVPIEDMYLPKIYERNFQKQGRAIWKTQMNEEDFHAEFDKKYPNAKYVVAGSRIAEDSLYYRLLGGTGVTSYNKVELIRQYDWLKDEYTLAATGILLNNLGPESNPTIAPMPFDHKMGPFTWGQTSPLDEKIAYGLPTPFLVKDPHKILNVGYTLMVEREFRAIDPPILSSDIESPELIYGQHRVIPVNDVDAYKEFKPSEASNQYFAMLNSLQANMRTQAQGGNSAVVPSRQPTSAKEVMQDSQEKQQSMANTVTMYYDLIRQEVLLVLKTAFQFYAADKYASADKRIYRTLLIPDMPLSLGGKGDLKIRFVKEKQADMDLFLESVRESARNGNQQEIIEVPIEFLQDLECQITKIDLEPETSDELELANWVETTLNPILNIYVPAGVADINKTFLRHMEKMGESPADFASDQTYKALFNGEEPPKPQAQPGVTPTADASAQAGNMQQVNRGIKFGGQNNRGLPIRQ